MCDIFGEPLATISDSARGLVHEAAKDFGKACVEEVTKAIPEAVKE